MTPTLKAVSVFIVLALGFAAPAAAESLEEAVLAYRRADYATALRHYRLLAEQGLAVAQFNLGLPYDLGQGVVQNHAEAMKWYRLATDQGRGRPVPAGPSVLQAEQLRRSGEVVSARGRPRARGCPIQSGRNVRRG